MLVARLQSSILWKSRYFFHTFSVRVKFFEKTYNGYATFGNAVKGSSHNSSSVILSHETTIPEHSLKDSKRHTNFTKIYSDFIEYDTTSSQRRHTFSGVERSILSQFQTLFAEISKSLENLNTLAAETQLHTLAESLSTTSISFRVDILQRHPLVLQLLQKQYLRLKALSPGMLCAMVYLIVGLGGNNSTEMVKTYLLCLKPSLSLISPSCLFRMLTLIAPHPEYAQLHSFWGGLIAQAACSIVFPPSYLCSLLHCFTLCKNNVDYKLFIAQLVREQKDAFYQGIPSILIDILFYLSQLQIVDADIFKCIAMRLLEGFPFVKANDRDRLLLALASFHRTCQHLDELEDLIFTPYPRKLTWLLSRWVEKKLSTLSLSEAYPFLVALKELHATNKFIARILIHKCGQKTVPMLSPMLFVGYVNLFNQMGLLKYVQVQHFIDVSLLPQLNAMTVKEVGVNIESFTCLVNKKTKLFFLSLYQQLEKHIEKQCSIALSESIGSVSLSKDNATWDEKDFFTKGEIVRIIRTFGEMKLHKLTHLPLLNILRAVCGYTLLQSSSKADIINAGTPPCFPFPLASSAYKHDQKFGSNGCVSTDNATKLDSAALLSKEYSYISKEDQEFLQSHTLLSYFSMPQLADIVDTLSVCKLSGSYIFSEAILKRYLTNGRQVSSKNLFRILTAISYLQEPHLPLSQVLLTHLNIKTFQPTGATQAALLLWSVCGIGDTTTISVIAEDYFDCCIKHYGEISLNSPVKSKLYEVLLCLKIIHSELELLCVKKCKAAHILSSTSIPPHAMLKIEGTDTTSALKERPFFLNADEKDDFPEKIGNEAIGTPFYAADKEVFTSQDASLCKSLFTADDAGIYNEATSNFRTTKFQSHDLMDSLHSDNPRNIFEDLQLAWRRCNHILPRQQAPFIACIGSILNMLSIINIFRKFISDMELSRGKSNAHNCGGFIPGWIVEDDYLDWAHPSFKIGILVLADQQFAETGDNSLHLLAHAALRLKYLEHVKQWKILFLKRSTVKFLEAKLKCDNDFIVSRVEAAQKLHPLSPSLKERPDPHALHTQLGLLLNEIFYIS